MTDSLICPTEGTSCKNLKIEYSSIIALLAQLVEQSLYTGKVGGSSPSGRTENMKIEKISPQFWNEDKEEGDAVALERENLYPHLEEIAKEVFRKENDIGSGNFSTVYKDETTGFCCKRLDPLAEKPLNNVHREAEFLQDLHGTSDKVKIPKPFVSMDAYMKNQTGKISRCSVLVMDTIKGVNLEEVLDGKKKLPTSFDADIFFANLKYFIDEIMHKQKGVYHRDIADRNIMVEEETGMPVIIDFGDSVYFSSAAVKAGEKNAYGHLVLDDGELPEDLDLKRLESVEVKIRQFLTKN